MAETLVFGVLQAGGLEVAIPAAALQEVVTWPGRIVPQPLSPDYVLGTFNLRGAPVPTIDLRRLMQVAEAGSAAGGRVVILQTRKGRLGVAVDDIADVVRTHPENLRRLALQAPAEKPLICALLIEQGGARIIQVLDPEALVAQRGVALAQRWAAAWSRFSQRGTLTERRAPASAPRDRLHSAR